MQETAKVSVDVRLPGALSAVVGSDEIILKVPSSLSEALAEIRQIPGVDVALREGNFVILVNGIAVQSHRKKAIHLEDGDVVALVPFVAGGWGA